MGSRGFLKLRVPKERTTGGLVGGYSFPKGLGLWGGNVGEGWLLSASLFLFSIMVGKAYYLQGKERGSETK